MEIVTKDYQQSVAPVISRAHSVTETISRLQSNLVNNQPARDLLLRIFEKVEEILKEVEYEKCSICGEEDASLRLECCHGACKRCWLNVLVKEGSMTECPEASCHNPISELDRAKILPEIFTLSYNNQENLDDNINDSKFKGRILDKRPIVYKFNEECLEGQKCIDYEDSNQIKYEDPAEDQSLPMKIDNNLPHHQSDNSLTCCTYTATCCASSPTSVDHISSDLMLTSVGLESDKDISNCFDENCVIKSCPLPDECNDYGDYGDEGIMTNCHLHGKSGIIYKCRFCCNVASHFCWGTTHFCSDCHHRQYNYDYMTNKNSEDLPDCVGKGRCQFWKHAKGKEYSICVICAPSG
eukprot:TRINITY_DN805_c0_g1_i3.p1 TRINITY_DN805_c0_g1~~TRINITY_DN805_c0_g1_i3.p1  ORF type:complete len:353 (+),score=51.24 TRINITY_DN805_c0_g1_i3:180-1238(+)